MSRTIDQQKSDPDDVGASTDPESGSGATLVLKQGADRAFVQSWLENRGLRAVPMHQAIQVAGTRADLDAALGSNGNETMPAELAPHVASIQSADRKYLH